MLAVLQNKSCMKIKKFMSSFSWYLGGGWLLQDETEYLFPSPWLPETHWSGRWMQTFYEKHVATEVAADALGENGRGMWFESVGTTNKVSRWSSVSWPMAESAGYWVKSVPVIDQGGLEKESANLSGVALWMPIWMFSMGIVKQRKIFLLSPILLCLVTWGSKELVESANFSVSLKVMSANVLWESH